MEIRTFISINLPVWLKEEVGDVIEELKSSVKPVKWVKTDSLHITLKFLGNVDVKKIGGIEKALENLSKEHNPLSLSFNGVGLFPNLKRPKVLWVGVEKNQKLNNLQNSIEEKLALIGYTKEKRPFSAHLTIGRIKDSLNTRGFEQKLSAYNSRHFGDINVDSIFLMKSDLLKEGAKYTIIKEFTL